MICSIVLTVHQSKAQSPSENLEQGIKVFNEMMSFQDEISDGATSEQIETMGTMMDRGLELFDLPLTTGTTDESRCAGYFGILMIYNYGYTMGSNQMYQDAYDMVIKIEEAMSDYGSSDFPINYKLDGEDMVIEWEDFEPTHSEFFCTLGELAYRLKKYEVAFRNLGIAASRDNISPFLKYVCQHFILDIREFEPSLVNDEDYSWAAFGSLKSYMALSSEMLQLVNEENYQKLNRGLSILLSLSRNADPKSIIMSRCAQAAALCRNVETEKSVVASLYEVCYQKYYQDAQLGLIYAFDESLPAYDFSKYSLNFAREYKSADGDVSAFIAEQSLRKMTDLTGDTECEHLLEIVTACTEWGFTELKTPTEKRLKACDDLREKENRAFSRSLQRSNSAFNIYLGSYVLALIAPNDRRDYGGVLNLSFANVAFEFSYLDIARKKENIFDLWIREVDDVDQDNLSRWDGFYAHFQPKIYDDNGVTYYGFLFGYAEKNFDPMTVDVTNDVSGIVTKESFDPFVSQYIFMFNFGGMKLNKGLGIDAYWGFGVNYSKFDDGSDILNADFTIDNPLLEGRRESYFGFIMRMGLTFGINLGQGNGR